MQATTGRQWAELLHAASASATPSDTDAMLRRAVALGHDVAPDTVGCSITTLDGEHYSTPVYSDQLAYDLDQAQYRSGDGPCMATARELRYHAFYAATDTDRYPGYCEAAVRRGVPSSISLPLPGGSRPSALNLYAGTAHAFDGERPQAVAGLLARCISAVLSGRPPDEPSGLAAARDRARLIAAAEDVLMASESVSRADALAMLMGRSRAQTRSIFEVARNVLQCREGVRA